MQNKELALNVLNNKVTEIIPFFPDISDWYKTKRLPSDQAVQIPTGSFIPDDLPLHENNFSMPEEFENWTYVDFYRNFDWGLPVHIYDWCDFNYNNVDNIVKRTENVIIRQFRTPVGTLQHTDAVAVDGSLTPVEHYVKEINDWKIIRYIIKNTVPSAKYGHINNILKKMGDLGIADLVFCASPFGNILH